MSGATTADVAARSVPPGTVDQSGDGFDRRGGHGAELGDPKLVVELCPALEHALGPEEQP